MILYVDNILTFWLHYKDSMWFVQKLEQQFGKLTVETSNEFTYLGMLIKIDEQGRYSVNMQKYIENMIDFHIEEEKLNNSKVPASKDK